MEGSHNSKKLRQKYTGKSQEIQDDAEMNRASSLYPGESILELQIHNTNSQRKEKQKKRERGKKKYQFKMLTYCGPFLTTVKIQQLQLINRKQLNNPYQSISIRSIRRGADHRERQQFHSLLQVLLSQFSTSSVAPGNPSRSSE